MKRFSVTNKFTVCADQMEWIRDRFDTAATAFLLSVQDIECGEGDTYWLGRAFPMEDHSIYSLDHLMHIAVLNKHFFLSIILWDFDELI